MTNQNTTKQITAKLVKSNASEAPCMGNLSY